MILQRKNRTKGGWEGESELRFILNSWFAGLWKLASPKSVGWFGKLEIQKIADATVEGCLLAEFLLVQGGQSFVPFKPSTNWMKPTHIIEGNLLHLKSTNCKCQSHLTTAFTATSRLVFNQTTRHYNLLRLTHKIEHNTYFGVFFPPFSHFFAFSWLLLTISFGWI